MLAAHALCALVIAAAGFSWPGALEADAQAIAKLPSPQRLRALEALLAGAGPEALPLLTPLLAGGSNAWEPIAGGSKAGGSKSPLIAMSYLACP